MRKDVITESLPANRGLFLLEINGFIPDIMSFSPHIRFFSSGFPGILLVNQDLSKNYQMMNKMKKSRRNSVTTFNFAQFPKLFKTSNCTSTTFFNPNHFHCKFHDFMLCKQLNTRENWNRQFFYTSKSLAGLVNINFKGMIST